MGLPYRFELNIECSPAVSALLCPEHLLPCTTELCITREPLHLEYGGTVGLPVPIVPELTGAAVVGSASSSFRPSRLGLPACTAALHHCIVCDLLPVVDCLNPGPMVWWQDA